MPKTFALLIPNTIFPKVWEENSPVKSYKWKKSPLLENPEKAINH